MLDRLAQRAAGFPPLRHGRQAGLDLVVGEHETVVAIIDDDAGRKRFQHAGQPPPRLLRLVFARLHAADVVVGNEPFAARQRGHRIDHRAAIGAHELARGNVARADFGEPAGDIVFPVGIGDIIDAVVAVDVHQGAEVQARTDRVPRDLPDPVEFAVDDFGLQVGIEQDDAHLHGVQHPFQVRLHPGGRGRSLDACHLHRIPPFRIAADGQTRRPVAAIVANNA